MYKPANKRPKKYDYDLIVVGSGSGGGVGAHIAASAGKKVAIIEADAIGGECPNYGCIPTKTLLHAADTMKAIQHAKEQGITTSANVNYKKIKALKDAAVLRTGTAEGEAFYKSEGIALLRGSAHFLSPWVINVGGKRFTARHFLLATGTRPSVPPIPGLSGCGYITYRDAIDFTELPKSMCIIGGGAIGSEFAELFHSFGVKVTLIEIAPRLLALEDPEVGDLITKLYRDRGMDARTSAQVTRIESKANKRVIHFDQDGHSHRVSVDQILLATGKAANTDFGLENAGVAYTRSGITTNHFMQTTAKHIYAAGDVVGPYRFTHTAAYQSKIAAHNLFHTTNRIIASYKAVPRAVFVEPEVASVGPTERELTEHGVSYQTAICPVAILGRANATNTHDGFVKVIASPKGKLLGASIVCPRSGEMIHELTLAIQHGLYAHHVAETIHAFPTWSEAVRKACQKIKGFPH